SAAGLAIYAMTGAAGLVFATPFVVRNLGDLLPGFLTSLGVGIAVAGVLATAQTLTALAGDPELATMVGAVAVAVLVFVIMPVRTWMRATIGRLLFRRGRLRWAELHNVVHALPPEAGVVECCRRALAELVRIMQLRGAAVVLHDGEVVGHGA